MKYLKDKIRKEKGIGSDVDIVLSLDQAGKQPADDEATLGALKIRHGSMLFAQLPKTAKVVSKTSGRKIVNGHVVAATYDDRSKHEGFRPGLMALRSMKMHWTLRDFNDLDSKYTFTVKGKQDVSCVGVSVMTNACDGFQKYAQSMAFSPRVAHLYGRIADDKKVYVDVFYEPVQGVDETGCAIVRESKRDRELVDRLATWLGLERVGFAFVHPVRDEDDVGFRFSAYELLEAAEQNLVAIDGDFASDRPFGVVVVTGNEHGKTEVDAFGIAKQSLEMIGRGALLEDEDEPGLLRVHETYTVMVEARETKRMSTYRCIKAVPILQHGAEKSKLSCAFPIAHRADGSDVRGALRAHFANAKGRTHVERVSDFQVLLSLIGVLGEDAVRDICKSVRDRSVPIKEGYRLMLDSLLGG